MAAFLNSHIQPRAGVWSRVNGIVGLRTMYANRSRSRSLASFTSRTFRQHVLAQRQDLGLDFVEQGRSLLLAQDMTGSVIHLFVARSGIDGKQLIHQFNDADRSAIQLVEFDRIDKLPPRMAPTRRMHHLRAAHAT